MTVAEDLRILGRMSYRQVVMILLSGLATWWLASGAVSVAAYFLWDWWQKAESESLGHAAMVAFYVSSVTEPLVTIVSLIAGLWVGYLTFSSFKKAIASSEVENP